MDMYKKREMSKKKREENIDVDKSYISVNINWDRPIYVSIAWSLYK